MDGVNPLLNPFRKALELAQKALTMEDSVDLGHSYWAPSTL